MSKAKRKRYSAAFKAKVGLEALRGVKTVGEIARDYQVHPVQVTQWKGVVRDHLPELFEPSSAKTMAFSSIGALSRGLPFSELKRHRNNLAQLAFLAPPGRFCTV